MRKKFLLSVIQKGGHMSKKKKKSPSQNMYDDGKWFDLKIRPWGLQVSQVNKLAAYIGDRLKDQLKIFEKAYRPYLFLNLHQVDYKEDFTNVFSLHITTTAEYAAVKDNIYDALYDMIYSLVVVDGVSDIELHVEKNRCSFLKKMASLGFGAEDEDLPVKYSATAIAMAQRLQTSSLRRIEMQKLWLTPAGQELPTEVVGGVLDPAPIDRDGPDDDSQCPPGNTSVPVPPDEDGKGLQLVLGANPTKKEVCLEALDFEPKVYFDSKKGEFCIRMMLNGVRVRLQYVNNSHEKVLAHLQKRLSGPITLVHDANADNLLGSYVIHDIVIAEDE